MPDPIHFGLQDPRTAPAGDKKTGVVVDRFGSVGAGPWKVYKSGVTTAETTADMQPQDAIKPFNGQQIEWLVIPPPSVTDYAVQAGRVITASGHADQKGFEVGHLHIDQAYTGLSASKSFTQDCQRDQCFLLITSITGTPGAWPTSWSNPGDTVVTKPNNAGGPPTGFLVLYRSSLK